MTELNKNDASLLLDLLIDNTKKEMMKGQIAHEEFKKRITLEKKLYKLSGRSIKG